jgi:FtsP/CotA-like multicopper oxidase with cupredoxin domain
MLHAEDEGPRRRTSVTYHALSGADFALGPHQHPSSRRKPIALASDSYQLRSKWVAALVITVVITIVFLLRGSVHKDDFPLDLGAVGHEDESEQTLGIILHPERHAYREPRNITLNWVISEGILAPDGVKKRVYLVNGMFPGPTIEARPQDELTINVHNSLEEEGISIHWHGVQVPNDMDGAVGFTQCPIQAGSSFTYRFKIGEQTGTYWWHAHFQSQRGDGLFGGFVIHQPLNGDLSTTQQISAYEKDILLMIGDWFHRPADDILKWYTNPGAFGNEPVPDSLLINGMGRFECSMAVASRPIDCEQIQKDEIKDVVPARVTSRLRIVNVGTIAGFSLSVTSATLKTVAVDGSPAVAADAAYEVGIIYPGERADVVLQWVDPSSKNSEFHVSLDPEYASLTLSRNVI